MSVDQGNVSKVLSVLSHPLRREILLNLSNNNESSFTDLLNLLKVDTGKLSFHLRALSPFIEQTPSGKYKLSRAGESAVRVIHDVESWAEVADVQGRASQLPLASFRNRAFAFLVDFALILAITMAITYLPSVLSLSTADFLTSSISQVLFITIGLLWLYSTLLEGFNGQSLGKRLLGLKVVRTDGKKMSYDHAAVRNFGKVLPLLPFDLLVGWRIKNSAFMRYFDKFAGTTVIDLRSHAP
ncbi:MAG: RDD family protein [Chloroflexi bacterium]|nr:RDD family protein [Chloroflexota bacterium]